MSSEEIIRAWKDPDGRGDQSGIDHPSGGIELTGQDEVGGTSWICISVETVSIATHALSCGMECQHTIYQGSCAFYTYACC